MKLRRMCLTGRIMPRSALIEQNVQQDCCLLLKRHMNYGVIKLHKTKQWGSMAELFFNVLGTKKEKK